MLTYDKKDGFYPLQVSSSTDVDATVVNVLMIANDFASHFVLITSINALLMNPNTRTTKHYCMRLVIIRTSHMNVR